MEQIKNEIKLSIENLKVLEDILLKFKIPLDKWGENGAKNISDLFLEIENGETKLIVKNGELWRETRVLSALIEYKKQSGENFVLREEKQVFKNGFVKERNLGSDCSVAEKIQSDETVETVLHRALKEELGVDLEINDKVSFLKREKIDRNSETYPGLNSKKDIYQVGVEIPKKFFSEGGYIERQKDKDVYFKWEKNNKEN